MHMRSEDVSVIFVVGLPAATAYSVAGVQNHAQAPAIYSARGGACKIGSSSMDSSRELLWGKTTARNLQSGHGVRSAKMPQTPCNRRRGDRRCTVNRQILAWRVAGKSWIHDAIASTRKSTQDTAITGVNQCVNRYDMYEYSTLMDMKMCKWTYMCEHLILLTFITGNSRLESLLEGLFAQIHIDLS